MAQRRVPNVVKDSRAQAVDPSTGLPLYGMDAELAAKAAAKYDPALDRQAREFLAGLVGSAIEGDLGDALHDGVLLCMAINVVEPKAVRRINKSRMPFKQMENITNFIRACRDKLGMREYDLFTTVALYEKKDMNTVINGIIAFGRAAQKRGFKGTGPKEATKNVRKFSASQLTGGVSKLNMGSAGIMERQKASASNDIGFGAGAGAAGAGGRKYGGGGTVSKLNMGSAGIMERQKASASNNIDFGAGAAAAGAGGRKYGGGGTVSKLNMGSAGIMERQKASASNNINFGAQAGNKTGKTSGYQGRKWGTGGGVSKLNMGSAGVMERQQASKSNDINFGAKAGGGAGAGGSVSRLNMGNYGVQDKPQQNYHAATQKMGYYRG